MIVGDIWLDGRGKLSIVLRISAEADKYGFYMDSIAFLELWKKDFESKFWILKIEPDQFNCLSEVMYVDCANLMKVSRNSFKKNIGAVEDSVVEKINILSARFDEHCSQLALDRRFEPRNIDKYDYDVALSFAGEDRSLVSQVAANLINNGVRVFYDDYEKANLWGKDLVQHLDDLYRNKAKYCIVFVSQHYLSKMWTNHELKSALARAVAQNEEYILPIKLDSTELPGLRPTVGYLSSPDPCTLSEFIVEKIEIRNLVNYAEFSAKWVENVLKINQKWGLDCLAFCVDPRFVRHEEIEYRLGLSYGINITSPRAGILAPPEQVGPNVFGIHCIAISKDKNLNLTDRWFSSIKAVDNIKLDEAVKESFKLLSRINDDDYKDIVGDSFTYGDLEISSRYLLDEFDISTEIG